MTENRTPGSGIPRRHFLKLSALGVALPPLLAACGTSGSSTSGGSGGGEIPVGIMSPLSGGGSPYGPNMLKAFNATADDINSAGGPNGQKLKLYTVDSQTKADAAVTAAQKFISVNHVVAILGTWSSSVTLAVLPITVKAKVIEISGSGAPEITTDKYQPYTFRTQPLDKPYGIAMATYANQKGYKNVSMMVLNTSYALALRESFTTKWEALGHPKPEVVLYNSGASSYSGEVSNALKSTPDLILVAGYTPDTSLIVKDLYSSNSKVPVMGPGFALNAAFIANVGAAAAEGTIAVDGAPPVSSPGFKAFAPEFKKIAGDDLASNFWAAQAHDQINILALAIQSAKSIQADKLVKAMVEISAPPGDAVYDFASGASKLRAGSKINYEGASGPCDFSKSHDVLTDFSVWVVKQGKLNQVQHYPASQLSD